MTATDWSAVAVALFVIAVPTLLLFAALAVVRVMDWLAFRDHRRRSRQRMDW